MSKLKLKCGYVEHLAVGLMVVLIDMPYDIIGVKYLHWIWHDTDPNIGKCLRSLKYKKKHFLLPPYQLIVTTGCLGIRTISMHVLRPVFNFSSTEPENG